MARTKKRDLHGGCARALMGEYGLPKALLDDVIEEIDAIYDPMRMAHCNIIKSIRGFMPLPQTHQLELFLERHKTHLPKHKKGEAERRPEFRGEYVEPSYDD